jgi:hypothetical protein
MLLLMQYRTTMVAGATVGVVTAVTVDTAWQPFKVSGAVIDVATENGEISFWGRRIRNWQKLALH